MRLHQVRYFLAICRDHNFTRAATRCGVAQPSLTQAIKALEAELGGPLFHRRRHGAELTDLGMQVEPYFAAIWRCVEEIKRAPRRVSQLDQELADSIARKLGLQC